MHLALGENANSPEISIGHDPLAYEPGHGATLAHGP
jgi:hypothetical protein